MSSPPDWPPDSPPGSKPGLPPNAPRPDPAVLYEIARMRMPFGRYRGRRLIDLPEPYVVWFRGAGFPRGRLGVLFQTLYDIKANGLEALIDPFREPGDPRRRDPGATPPRDAPGRTRGGA